ncbi:MAG: class IV adenylate cyclase [Desulfovibrio sp.]|jgi:adenylate cyclase class 2|nr:class IV adenylate cyclase [Desulfovibrio sp.]
MALETERKYLEVDFANLRAVLAECGAKALGVHFESNCVFDTHGEELFADGRLLRLRTQEWPDGKRFVLTLKLPAQQRGGFKTREEYELEIADDKTMQDVLEGLGYSVRARYEKIRETWQLQDVKIDLDILPFIQAVELEGEVDGILRVAACLGLDKARQSVKNYYQLHQEWLRQHCLPPVCSFVFSEEQQVFWRRRLGLTATVASWGE